MLAGIRLLGQDMAKMSDPRTLKTLKDILDNETGKQSKYSLVSDMVRGMFMTGEEIIHKLEKLKEGL